MDFTLAIFSKKWSWSNTSVLLWRVIFIATHQEEKYYMYKTNFSPKKSLKYNLKKNNN